MTVRSVAHPKIPSRYRSFVELVAGEILDLADPWSTFTIHQMENHPSGLEDCPEGLEPGAWYTMLEAVYGTAIAVTARNKLKPRRQEQVIRDILTEIARLDPQGQNLVDIIEPMIRTHLTTWMRPDADQHLSVAVASASWIFVASSVNPDKSTYSFVITWWLETFGAALLWAIDRSLLTKI